MAVEAELKRYSEQDSRIRYRLLEKNEGISGNTNAALEMTEGEYVGLFDHDDILAPNALYEVVNALQEKKYDILYTDEDKITGDGKEHNDPNFKPDFSMDLFRSHNYITHFFVVKTEIIKGIGGFRAEYDGSQDYDLMFRCIENSENIKHIPMILYHWRIHMNSVAGDPSSKMYAYEAGKKAIEDHLKRMGIKATVEHVGLWGMYHVIYDTPGDPLISIVIPNKDHVDDLDKCIQSILTKSIYKNYEFVIVENNSEEQKTLNAFVNGMGQYIGNFIPTALKINSYSDNSWFGSWRLFYWAWFIAWAPFVGVFVARISKGRTIREFVLGVVLVPTIASCIWGAVFGNLGINLGEKGLMAIEKLQEAVATPEVGLFVVLGQYPLGFILSLVALVSLCAFFVTSANSGVYVLSMLSTDGAINPPNGRKILWGVIQSVMAIGLLMAGGLKPLQTISLVAAFLFIFVMLGTIAAFIKVLKEEKA